MAKRLSRTTIVERNLEPVIVDEQIVARRGVGTRIKVEVPGQLVELMVVGASAEAVRAACEQFNIEYDAKTLGEALVVRPTFFDNKIKPPAGGGES